jgi:hypothetical protein
VNLLAADDTSFKSIGLSGRAHVLVLFVCVIGALFLLRLLRRRQLRGKYTLLWIVTGVFVLVIASAPSLLDRTARSLRIYNSPNLLFALALAFLLLVCVYFSYELSRLEERTRILAEELAILRAERDAALNGQAKPVERPAPDAPTPSVPRD